MLIFIFNSVAKYINIFSVNTLFCNNIDYLIFFRYRLIKESMLDEETDQMVTELRLYYNLDNSKQLHGNDCQFVVIPEEFELFVKKLFNIYPSFIKVSDLSNNNEQVNTYE